MSNRFQVPWVSGFIAEHREGRASARPAARCAATARMAPVANRLRGMTRTVLATALAGMVWGGIAAEPDAEGFVSVFNGQDLSGWIGATQSYAVENGVLYSKPDGAGNLMLAKQYADFILRFDFLLTPNGNNGVAVRMKTVSGGGTLNGMELQILDDDGDQYKKLKDYQYNGSIYGVTPAKRGFLKPVGQWNSQEVRAIGSRITVVLNGTVIVDQDLKEVKETPDGREHPCLHNAKGYLGFMGHHSRVDFRNIRIKEIQ